MVDSPVPAAMLPVGLREGDVLAGRYRIEHVVGKGGMGVVVAAHHLELEGRVAIKFLSPEALSAPEAVARFDREIRAAARLKSEHVARVHDAGKLADGGRYMVLEFLDGEDLAARVRRQGPLEPSLAVRYLLQACAAVLEAHGLGIVHRDLKPANLFVIVRADGTESIKVLDFGVMKRLSGAAVTAEPQPTEPGTIIGTPLYTSPEQLRGSASVDARTDIWSLGVTLYELLCGVPPFSGKTYAQIIANVLEAEPVPLHNLCPLVSPELESVILRCLEKDPTQRYESVADLAQALSETVELDSEQRGLLERMARHKQVSSPFASSAALATPLASLRSTPGFTPARGALHPAVARERKNRLLLIGAVAIVTSTVVISLGLPYLPRFGAPRQPIPKLSAAPIAPGTLASLPAAPSPLAPAIPSAEPAPTASLAQKSTKTTERRKTTPKLPTNPPATAGVATAPSVEPTREKKNPLLVGPK
jgi:serine/threonine-protein kinase